MLAVFRVSKNARTCGTRYYSVAVEPVPPRPYRFHVGASFAGKPSIGRSSKKGITRFPPNSETALWVKQQLSIPKRVPTTNAGEDAFFVQEMKHKSGVAVGVADGVGGWSDSGVDPSLFSQSLMFHSHDFAKKAWAGESDTLPETEEEETSSSWELTPEECMELAHGAVLRDKLVMCGSSTACLATFNARNGKMRAANLGDSGFMIIRKSAIIHQQAPQTHYFNCPRQLAKLRPIDRRNGSILDLPSHADSFSASLLHGDIVVLYTDGVSDNVWPQELNQLVSLALQSTEPEERQAQEAADNIVEYSKMCMYQRNKPSPFEHESRLQGHQWRGGKEDDTTAVVVLVSETGDGVDGIV